MNLDEILRGAKHADAEEDHVKVISLATTLIEAGEPWAISGYLLRAGAYESMGDENSDFLTQAVQDYRRLAVLAPHHVTYQNLARSLMRLGHESYPAALGFLDAARNLKETPEILLGFAEFYRTKHEPEYALAKKYYRMAAVRGRFQGFFGYAEVSRILGQNYRSLTADCLRLVVGPFLWLLLGSKARFRF